MVVGEAAIVDVESAMVVDLEPATVADGDQRMDVEVDTVDTNTAYEDIIEEDGAEAVTVVVAAATVVTVEARTPTKKVSERDGIQKT